MRVLLLNMLIISIGYGAFSQNDPGLKFIFVPHPRSENKIQQSVLPEIEKIDFSLYDMILLGGDLTYYTSINRTAMDYCDKLFNLKSPNTLWTMGNHDLNSRSLVKEYTGRPSYYSYFRDNITFLVLDTELNANGFTSSTISGEQLAMVKNVSDTISKSDYLIVLHGRLLWMIGNKDFKTRIDSVAESTKQLVSTNFYQDVFPLLQKVKSKGIPVFCLGGDKSKINIDYSPEDNIRFFASTMAPEFTADQNDVMVFDFSKKDRKMSWRYVSLTNIEKKTPVVVDINQFQKEKQIKVWQTSGEKEIGIQIQSVKSESTVIRIYSTDGILYQSLLLKSNEIGTVRLNKSGLFIIKATIAGSVFTDKIVAQ